MASLLVRLHEIVEDYVKKTDNKELAGKIGSGVLAAARNVVKTYMFDPTNALQYVSVQPMNILTREIMRINSMLVRRMRPTPLYRSPWKVCFTRYMPREVFGLLDECIQLLNSQSSRSVTKCTVRVVISDEAKLMQLFMQLANGYNTKNNKHLNESHLLQTKLLHEGQQCKIIVSVDKPFLLSYSVKREILKLTFFMVAGMLMAFHNTFDHRLSSLDSFYMCTIDIKNRLKLSSSAYLSNS